MLKKVIFIMNLIFVFILITGCGTVNDLPEEEANNEVNEVVHISSDWVYFDDLDSLVEISKNIIVGKVEKQLPYIERVFGEPTDDHPVTYTPFSITVLETLKGELSNLTDITIIQMGGLSSDGNVFYIADDEPCLEVGETYLIFMNGADKYGYYQMNTPMVSYIKIENGELHFTEDKINLFSKDDEVVYLNNATNAVIQAEISIQENAEKDAD